MSSSDIHPTSTPDSAIAEEYTQGWDALDQALIEGHGKIGILTDREKTPAAIAVRMLHYGYTNYKITAHAITKCNHLLSKSIRTSDIGFKLMLAIFT